MRDRTASWHPGEGKAPSFDSAHPGAICIIGTRWLKHEAYLLEIYEKLISGSGLGEREAKSGSIGSQSKEGLSRFKPD